MKSIKMRLPCTHMGAKQAGSLVHPFTDISGGDIGSGLPAGYRGRTQNRLPTENNLATTMGEAYGRSDANPRHKLIGR